MVILCPKGVVGEDQALVFWSHFSTYMHWGLKGASIIFTCGYSHSLEAGQLCLPLALVGGQWTLAVHWYWIFLTDRLWTAGQGRGCTEYPDPPVFSSGLRPFPMVWRISMKDFQLSYVLENAFSYKTKQNKFSHYVTKLAESPVLGRWNCPLPIFPWSLLWHVKETSAGLHPLFGTGPAPWGIGGGSW